ncbi:hypothetical protein GALMADRAFT_808902 [Galerina marginata CBS 339.88]|uniref:Uncharacterized protein n=1 Tax=Galerina marginata (strain CBS 339.88) TaxID=685588 RepID=A0A067SWM2_GALM3|nr:hypothetical protein GALMADRAFT_808902 [Galerina marginata CBS 339.88]
MGYWGTGVSHHDASAIDAIPSVQPVLLFGLVPPFFLAFGFIPSNSLPHTLALLSHPEPTDSANLNKRTAPTRPTILSHLLDVLNVQPRASLP